MVKTRYYLSMILIICSILLLISTAVFGWMVFTKKKSMSSFEAGEILTLTYANGSAITTSFQLEDLAYVGFFDDIYLDRSNVLNQMASVGTIRIINDIDSVDIKNLVEIDITGQTNGLFYLIVYEGKNVPVEQIGLDLDYHAIIQTIIGSESSEIIQRQLLTDYNANTIQTIHNEQLSGADWISFQIAVWGDYEALAVPLNYLSYTYSLNLNINFIQWEGMVE